MSRLEILGAVAFYYGLACAAWVCARLLFANLGVSPKLNRAQTVFVIVTCPYLIPVSIVGMIGGARTRRLVDTLGAPTLLVALAIEKIFREEVFP